MVVRNEILGSLYLVLCSSEIQIFITCHKQKMLEGVNVEI